MQFSARLTWALIFGYLWFSVLKTFTDYISPTAGMILNMLILVAITVFHARAQYGFKTLGIFFVIIFVISNAYENMSVMTGFPFGNYIHADSLGPKLFLIPIIIAPTYFVVGYFSWSIALVLINAFEKKLAGHHVWTVPLVASFVMTMWDLQVDSISSTIKKGWFWHDGGHIFGVPFINYMGWLLCTFTFFLVFSIYLNHRSASENKQRVPMARSHWYQSVCTYFILSLPIVVLPLISTDAIVTDPTGKNWGTMDIYQNTTLVTIFTMWFVCLLSVIKIHDHQCGRR